MNKKELQKQEEKEMQKFVDFMRKQGLVVVDAAKMKELSGDGTDRQKPRHVGGDDSSIVTIYKNAVQKDGNSKRDSSSSDKMLDTSDEVDKLNLDQMTTTDDNVI